MPRTTRAPAEAVRAARRSRRAARPPVARRTRAGAVPSAAVVEPATVLREPYYAKNAWSGPTFDGKGGFRRKPAPDPIGWIDGFGDKQPLGWSWDDPCPKCSAKTEFGYCTRCTWVCENSARPKPEPILVGHGAEA